MAVARWASLGLLAGLLLACGQTRHADDDADGGDMAGGGASAVGGGDQGGHPALITDPGLSEPGAPAPHGPCDCPYTRLGMTVMLGETNERLGFNIAEQSVCAVDQPAHIRVTSGCGQSVSLALSADAAGGIPRLTIEGMVLTYTDRQNEVWTGLLPSFEERPDEGSVLTSSLQMTVVNARAGKAVLQLGFELCADWSGLRVPC
jgi:hypothetical protein